MSTVAVRTLIPNVLTICTYGGFAPVCYRDKFGVLTGFDVGFLTRFADSIGLKIMTLERPFDALWLRPGNDECDIAGAGIMQRVNRPIGEGASWTRPYFRVKRTLLVRLEDQPRFEAEGALRGEGMRIVATQGSTADYDAQIRYPNRKALLYLADLSSLINDPGQSQREIVRLIAEREVDAFGEGDVSNEFLRDSYNRQFRGVELAVADKHDIDEQETFNFIVRNVSDGLLDALNSYIGKHANAYA
ncbi:transporter substrate-binding domain-containing protein [Variovorax humicola]|uniref:Transporter substrate-binding domain-containing protein n=1 Tax=Variovorax humicola TaxID=1769758 RepID=A0ABU8WA16_9BURK